MLLYSKPLWRIAAGMIMIKVILTLSNYVVCGPSTNAQGWKTMRESWSSNPPPWLRYLRDIAVSLLSSLRRRASTRVQIALWGPFYVMLRTDCCRYASVFGIVKICPSTGVTHYNGFSFRESPSCFLGMDELLNSKRLEDSCPDNIDHWLISWSPRCWCFFNSTRFRLEVTR